MAAFLPFAVVSVDWLPQLVAHERASSQLVAIFFKLAPAPVAFSTLLG